MWISGDIDARGKAGGGDGNSSSGKKGKGVERIARTATQGDNTETMNTRDTIGFPTSKSYTSASYIISCSVEGHRSYTLCCNNWLRLNRLIKQGFRSHTFSRAQTVERGRCRVLGLGSGFRYARVGRGRASRGRRIMQASQRRIIRSSPGRCRSSRRVWSEIVVIDGTGDYGLKPAAVCGRAPGAASLPLSEYARASGLNAVPGRGISPSSSRVFCGIQRWC
jgi:hypothetical protein